MAGYRSANSNATGINLDIWNPDNTYTKNLKEHYTLAPSKVYKKYLELKKINRNSAVFYIDSARFFYQIKEYELALRILSNIVELYPEHVFFQRMLAFNLLEFNFYTEGIEVLERVKNIRPYQGPSYRDLAIAWQRYSEHTRNNQDAAQAFAYFKAAVFEHWGEDSDGSEPLRMTALEELNHLLYKTDSNIFDLEDIQPNLLFSMPKDIRIVVSWNSRAADVDLHITEPSGEEVSYSKPLSKTGGLMPYDDVDGFGPEEYMIRNATKGKYHISLDLFSNNSIELFGPVSVSLDVFTNYGKKNEKHKKTTICLDKEGKNIPVGELIL